MSSLKEHIVLCGKIPSGNKFRDSEKRKIHRFECDPSEKKRNVNIDLPHFKKLVGCHIPERYKDLLEIAGYVYAADRMIDRGSPTALEFQAWSRKLHFHIKVRDFAFWGKKATIHALSEALTFVSGDNSYEFSFYKGGKDHGQMSLTDSEEITFEKKNNSHVCLFSGGLDSLAGALQSLGEGKNLILISHRSNNIGVSQIQKGILNRLMTDFPERIQPFHFSCNLKGERAVEETQRTRIFLYTSIAISLMNLASDEAINIFENGITSINVSKRQDAINARASRTTHPKTLFLLQNFFSLLADKEVKLNHPFLLKTKSDVLNIIKEAGKASYINSTLTCTKTFLKFKNDSSASHCGRCSQCIDRRIAAFSTELEDYDATYDMDISKDSIKDTEGFTHLHDYIFKSFELRDCSQSNFAFEFFNELTDITPYIAGSDNAEKTQAIYDLMKNHSACVDRALGRIRAIENLSKPMVKNSIFEILSSRTHLKSSMEVEIEKICGELKQRVPLAFQTQKPSSEKVLNDQIQALLGANGNGYTREFPVLKFGSAKTVPDHAVDTDLFIEAKYPRNKKSQSQLTDEIAADITKYGEVHKLFVIYDPERKIANDDEFVDKIDSFKNCKAIIIR
ncbi:MAG: hypothetical protein ACOZCO_05130 [Bacteroidota bacterium]